MSTSIKRDIWSGFEGLLASVTAVLYCPAVVSLSKFTKFAVGQERRVDYKLKHNTDTRGFFHHILLLSKMKKNESLLLPKMQMKTLTTEHKIT